MKFDLHMHSAASADGQYSVEELIAIAKEKNLEVIALSDHNTVANVDEMMHQGQQAGIKVIPAVECTTAYGDLELHCLAYGLNHHDDYFESLAQRVETALNASTLQRIKLFETFFKIDLDETYYVSLAEHGFLNQVIEHLVQEPQLQNNPDIAPFLPGGALSNPLVPNFYYHFCASGQPCYINVNYPDFGATVKAIHEAGGVAILAHPWTFFDHDVQGLNKIFETGLDGLEAYSNYHSPQQNQFYEEYAREHNYIFTCGSDFHGRLKPDIEMGATHYLRHDEARVLDKLYKRIDQRSLMRQ